MTRAKKAKAPLPKAPTGYEEQDLEWTRLAPRAEFLVDLLLSVEVSRDAGSLWRAFAASDDKKRTVVNELLKTKAGSTMWRLRQREWNRQHLVSCRLALEVSSVLLRQLKRRHPKASAGQLLVLLRDATRELAHEGSEPARKPARATPKRRA